MSIQKQTLKHASTTLNKQTQNIKPTTQYLRYKINCNHNSIQQTHYHHFKSPLIQIFINKHSLTYTHIYLISNKETYKVQVEINKHTIYKFN